MTTLEPSEAINVDFAPKRDKDRVACFLHLRDLVYLHRESASASTIALVRTLEAAVIAEKAAREKRLAAVRERERQKAAAERARAEKEKSGQVTADVGDG